MFMERMCPELGTQSVKIVSDYNWYIERMNGPMNVETPDNAKKFNQGCPLDCGPCECHSAPVHLPVFSITNDCNLNCKICFTHNRPDKKYYKSVQDTKKIIEYITNHAGYLDLINLTGGEPTLHPDIFDILEACKSQHIGRITMNTNGIKIAGDFAFAEKIKQSGVQLVLSVDTFDPEKSMIIHGKDITVQKRRTLEILEQLNIPTTILCVCIKHVNEQDVSDIAAEYFTKEFVHSITIQNMTFTGANGAHFEPRDHITIDEVENLLAAKNGFSTDDFFPLSTYHPLCYSAAYYIVHQQRILSLTRLIDKNILHELCSGSYVLNANVDMGRYFRDGIDRLWAEGEDEELLTVLRNFVKELYPADKKLMPQERRAAAEKMIKMIYIHPHMDADNFDIARVSRCGDVVPDESGNMVPACAYNLIYRQRDSRFWKEG